MSVDSSTRAARWKAAALVLAGVVLGQQAERVFGSAQAAPETPVAPAEAAPPVSTASAPVVTPARTYGRAVLSVRWNLKHQHCDDAANRCCPKGFRPVGYSGGGETVCLEDP